MTRRRRVFLWVGLTALGLLAASQYWVWAGRFAPVVPGRLYRSAELPPASLAELCRRHSITLVVDFRKDSPLPAEEAEVLRRAGIAHLNLPTGQVPSPATVARFLEEMDRRPRDRVLLHCAQGVGRTGVFSAIYRMEYQGWSPRAATIEQLIFSGFGSFRPGSDKARFLAAYRPQRTRTER